MQTLHAHCSVFMTLTQRVNLFIPTFVDIIISGKFLENQKTLLRHIFRKHNMHNPGDQLNRSADCMIDYICSKHFPKNFDD